MLAVTDCVASFHLSLSPSLSLLILLLKSNFFPLFFFKWHFELHAVLQRRQTAMFTLYSGVLISIASVRRVIAHNRNTSDMRIGLI